MATICGTCQTENSGPGKFCVQCGAPLAAAAPPPPPSPPVAPPPPPPPATPPPPMRPAPPPSGPPPARPAAPAPAPAKGKGAKTVLLILGGLLLACCLLTVVAGAFFYWKRPAFLTSGMDTARQKAAVLQVQSVSAALEAYRLSNNAYPPVNRGGDTDYGIGDFTDLKRHLEPDFIASLPDKDPWGNPLLYGSNLDGSSCIVLCMGSDGAQGDFGVPDTPTPTQCFEDDIIGRDGQLVQYPEGEQQHCLK